MSDENPTSNQPENPLDGTPEIESPKPPDPPKAAKLNTPSELQDVKRELSGYERATLRWTIVIVAINVLTCLFIGLQSYEMKTGSVDTHNLAVASGNQAIWTQRLADSAQIQSDKTQALADRTKDLADRMKDQADQTTTIAAQAIIQANAAQKSVATAQQQLDSSERPWMKVDAGLFIAQGETSPASFDSAGGLHLNAVINGQIVGRSPAVKVLSMVELIPSTQRVKSIEDRQRKMCEDIHGLSLSTSFQFGSGDTVFPLGDPYRLPQFLSLNAATIKAELSKPSNKTWILPKGQIIENSDDGDDFYDRAGYDDPLTMAAKRLGGVAYPGVSLIGCLDYSVDYSSVRHQTMFLYDLKGVDLRTSKIGTMILSKRYGIGNSAN
jgi:hypothetical protein